MNDKGCDRTRQADCKYCWHTTKFGKATHFYCGAFEYCCGDKCCENFDEFYKLWYFWLCVLVLLMSTCIALYWLRRRYMLNHCPSAQVTVTVPRHRRRHRRYRQLSGEGTGPVPVVIIPDSVITEPPPYMGEASGCPHGGPPPYCLGSGTSINSMPRFPPAYENLEKFPPPSYSSVVEIDNEKASKKSSELNSPSTDS